MNSHAAYSFHNMGSPPPPPQPMSSSQSSSSIQSSHPGPPTSPSQSVPGRRTPLGTVGLGGFYAQGHTVASAAHIHTDENRPGGSALTRWDMHNNIDANSHSRERKEFFFNYKKIWLEAVKLKNYVRRQESFFSEHINDMRRIRHTYDKEENN